MKPLHNVGELVFYEELVDVFLCNLCIMKEIAFSWYSLSLILCVFTLYKQEFLKIFCKFIPYRKFYFWSLSIADINM
jgi:hypothetical protein